MIHFAFALTVDLPWYGPYLFGFLLSSAYLAFVGFDWSTKR